MDRLPGIFDKIASLTASQSREKSLVGAGTKESKPIPEQAEQNVSASPGAAGEINPRILLIPLEFMSWERAKSWSYTGALAIEEGLAANRAECLVIPAWFEFASDSPDSLLAYAQELCAGKTFDQVWIWLTHNQYRPEFLTWVASIAPIRVGLTMESMEHSETELTLFPQLRGRQEFVQAQLRYMTHVLVADELDAVKFRTNLPVQALWYPPMVPERCVAKLTRLPEANFATFAGAIYSQERMDFLQAPALKELLQRPVLPERATSLPEEFDRLHQRIVGLLRQNRKCEYELLIEYVNSLRAIRRRLFDSWLDGLRLGFASVNLPSVFKSYAGRVVESMAAGTAVVSWSEPQRLRNLALFTPGEEILLFDRQHPKELETHLQLLKNDPSMAQKMAEKARKKILAGHTAEIRARQILHWIRTGTEPDYAVVNLTEPTATEDVSNKFCLPPGYRARPVPNYFEDKYTAETGMVWQPDVYAFAASVARKLGCNRIIDIGCGHGQKLSELQGEFETIGVDFGSNLEYCRSHYAKGQWLEADFEKAPALAVHPEVASSAVVISSDVIEHMINPAALLAKIKTLLEHAVMAIISTPERELTWGSRHNGPPPNVESGRIRRVSFQRRNDRGIRRYYAQQRSGPCTQNHPGGRGEFPWQTSRNVFRRCRYSGRGLSSLASRSELPGVYCRGNRCSRETPPPGGARPGRSGP